MKQRVVNTILIKYGFSLNDATLTAHHFEAIRKAAPDAELTIIRNEEEWKQRSPELGSKVQVVFGKHPAEWVKEMPNFFWGQQTGTGTDWLLDFPEVVESDLLFTIMITKRIPVIMAPNSIHTASAKLRLGIWERR